MSQKFLLTLLSGVLISVSAFAVTPPRPINDSQNQNNDQDASGGRMMITNQYPQDQHQQDSSSSQSNDSSSGQSSSQNKSKSQVVTTNHPIATFKLRSNPSTGFTWYIKNYPKHLIKIKSHEMKRPSKDNDRVGAPGYEVWQFKAKKAAFKAPHVIKITLMYARPWMVDGHSSQTRNLYVITH